MSDHEEAMARHDVFERLTYAAVLDDHEMVRDVLGKLTAEALLQDEPASEVRDALVANDPVSAAAAGWITFDELRDRVASDPDLYLDPDEAKAFAKYGPHVLRLVVAARTEGVSFQEAREHANQSGRDQYALAARGLVERPDAVLRLLREHGLRLDDEELGE